MYSVTDLGVLPAYQASWATDINDAGEVVGSSGFLKEWRSGWQQPSLEPYYSHAFLWNSNAGMQDLGTLPNVVDSATGFHSPEAYSVAHRINNAGEVIGKSYVIWFAEEGGPAPTNNRVFLWSSSTGMQDLGVGGTPSDVNNVGQVVGTLGGFHAFLWSSSASMQVLGTTLYPRAINDMGQVVGIMQEPAHAFLWSSSAGIQDLGALPGTRRSQAFDINDAGQVVGETDGHLFLWTSSTGMQDLGAIPILPQSINDTGQIVGSKGGLLRSSLWGPWYPIGSRTDFKSYLKSNSISAVLWSASTGVQDLNNLIPADSGWWLTDATSINNGGQIVGAGIYNGQDGQGVGVRAYLLTPS